MSKDFSAGYSHFRRILGSLLLCTVILQSCTSYEFKTSMKNADFCFGKEPEENVVKGNGLLKASSLALIGGVCLGYMACVILDGSLADSKLSCFGNRRLSENVSYDDYEVLVKNYTSLNQNYTNLNQNYANLNFSYNDLLSYQIFVAPAYASCTASLANMTAQYSQCSNSGQYPYCAGLYDVASNFGQYPNASSLYIAANTSYNACSNNGQYPNATALYNVCSNNGARPNAYDNLSSLCHTRIECTDGNTCGYGGPAYYPVSSCGINGSCGRRLDFFGNSCYNI